MTGKCNVCSPYYHKHRKGRLTLWWMKTPVTNWPLPCPEKGLRTQTWVIAKPAGENRTNQAVIGFVLSIYRRNLGKLSAILLIYSLSTQNIPSPCIYLQKLRHSFSLYQMRPIRSSQICGIDPIKCILVYE